VAERLYLDSRLALLITHLQDVLDLFRRAPDRRIRDRPRPDLSACEGEMGDAAGRADRLYVEALSEFL
jgi:hypothetical protein